MNAPSYERREGDKRGPTDEEEISRKQEAARAREGWCLVGRRAFEVVQLGAGESESASSSVGGLLAEV